jgi:hypothetical protein
MHPKKDRQTKVQHLKPATYTEAATLLKAGMSIMVIPTFSCMIMMT